MKKSLIAVVVAVLLSGCDADFTANKFETICLDGVEYWTTNYNARPHALAIKADPVTLAPVRCDQ